MTNQLTYSEICDICAAKKITVTKLAEKVEMTLHGLKAGLQRQTLSSQVIYSVCKELCLTPNQFFRWESNGDTFNTTQVGVMNSQNIGSNGIELLQHQLVVKDEQIKVLMELLKNK